MQKRTRYARALMMPFLILCVLLCGLFINENTAFRDPAEEKAAHPAALPYIGDEMEGGDRPGDGRIHFQRRCCLPIYEPDDTGNLWLSAISGKWPYLCIGFLLILVAAASVVIFFFGKFCLPHDAEIVAAGAFSAFGSLAVLSSALGVWLITRPHLPAAENGSGPLGILHDLSLALLPTGTVQHCDLSLSR